jgi:hypothetical protein
MSVTLVKPANAYAKFLSARVTVWAESAEIALPKGIWCGASILGPARRLHINNVPGRMKTMKPLATYR